MKHPMFTPSSKTCGTSPYRSTLLGWSVIAAIAISFILLVAGLVL